MPKKDDKAYDIVDLQTYMKALPANKLQALVLDMYWKDQTVRQSELFRFMLLLRDKGVPMTHMTGLTKRPNFSKDKPEPRKPKRRKR